VMEGASFSACGWPLLGRAPCRVPEVVLEGETGLLVETAIA